ncbi:DNA/RNA non-specific endonuclease [Flavilitoribacter nigricans]|uniref:Endonuclease n=1 Tax=Flavilitoribacter nigricans (strain ATCC 23147 / DSM 23189 / NBRC 102662 / NCIMB 1420 / SS-2) TaxID=1122177 RepID=A0A2D0NE99_FLAN2|nr:DNA/RNA non-specific endonuclease [Flavilitoribacter nigricans]PHN06696.1 endonuclease [Flavilitoribacter nigricans DSM 23189 = NBRC 102662]
MYRRILFYLILGTLLPIGLDAQPLEKHIDRVENELQQLKEQEQRLKAQLEGLKLSRIQRDLRAIGLPGEDYIMHQAMALAYSEDHEQAAWVAHIILPDIVDGEVTRTNDFREDPLVRSGTAVEADYFLKFPQADGSSQYDGFGYDRGHLAPSADFRWSETALSESYFYSNMAPQLADFNRVGWADLESTIRGYIFRHPGRQLYVVTGGILEKDLPVIERGVNGVSIPRYFYKVVLDAEAQTGIGFLMPNERLAYPLETYAVTIDEVEKQTGFDFFSNLPDKVEQLLESKLDKQTWFPEVSAGDVEPIFAPSLAAGHFNTAQAKAYMGTGNTINVCGQVVSSRYSRSGNLWLNLDKQYPNQIFSVYIRKADLVNFPFDGEKHWLNQQVCFTGVVQNMNGTPTIRIEREEEARLMEDGK